MCVDVCLGARGQVHGLFWAMWGLRRLSVLENPGVPGFAAPPDSDPEASCGWQSISGSR